MNVAVNRLTVKGACDAPHHQAFLIEDALNTQIASENRLVLVRTLSLLPTAPSGGNRRDQRVIIADSVANGWNRVMASACHGGADHAAAANSVWFRDVVEAKALLLARLLKGQSVDGWFWRLAVRLWQGQDLAHWIAEELLADPHDAPGNGAIYLLERLLAEGRLEIAEAAVVHYLQCRAEPDWFSVTASAMRAPTGSPFAAEVVYRNGSKVDESNSEEVQAEYITRLAASLPVGLSAMLQKLYAQSLRRNELVSLAARFLSKAAPELGLRPRLLQYIAQHFLVGHKESVPLSHPRKSTVQKAVTEKRHVKQVLGPNDEASQSDVPAIDRDRSAQIKHHNMPDVEFVEGEAPATFFETPTINGTLSEQRSAAAGLFYIVNLLRILDWPAWLAARPALLSCRPTAQLLRYIALNHRADPGDPVLAFLNRHLDHQNPMDPEYLTLWRKALDRWLRRTTRMNLSTLVNRNGWIQWHDDRVAVRFAVQAVEMRLRRLALDRDPGWVPWAGLSVRFHFSDQPLLRDGLTGSIEA